MAFEELSENLQEQILLLKSRVEESRFVNSINEKFSSFPKRVQMLIISFFCLLLCFVILIYPMNQYRTSLEFEADYEERKDFSQKIITYA